MLLTRIDPQTNMARFYRLDITTDLFGGVLLVRNWGRIGQMGRERSHWFADHDSARAAMEKWHRRKAARGYLAVLG